MVSEPVKRLMRLPMPTNHREEWLDYTSLGISARDGEYLKEIASPVVVTRGKLGAAVFAPAAHAWRAMAQMRTPGAVPVIIDLLATLVAVDLITQVDEDSTFWVLNESGRVLSEFGPAALPELFACMRNAAVSHWARCSCADAATIIAERTPEERGRVIDELAECLAGYMNMDADFTCGLVACLLRLDARGNMDLLKRVVRSEPRMSVTVEKWPAELQAAWLGRGKLVDQEVCEFARAALLLSYFDTLPDSIPVERLYSLRPPKDDEPCFDYSVFGIDSEHIPLLIETLNSFTPTYSCLCVGRNLGVFHCCRALAQMRALASIEPIFRLTSRALADSRSEPLGNLLLDSEIMYPFAAHAVDPLLRIAESAAEEQHDRVLAVEMLVPPVANSGSEQFREALTMVVEVLQSSTTSWEERMHLDAMLRELDMRRD